MLGGIQEGDIIYVTDLTRITVMAGVNRLERDFIRMR